jgi:hypothetical protein
MAMEINENMLRNVSTELGEEYYVEQEYNKQFFSFYVFNNYARYIKGKKSGEKYVEIIWNKTNEYYRMFCDWYHNRRWYHLIGYLIAVSGKKYIEMLSKLSSLYKSGATDGNQAGHKTLFEEKLRNIIIERIASKGNMTRQDLEEYIDKLEYGKDNTEIRNILLLYNISSLEHLEKMTDARFPFDKYKSVDMAWDIEHINAVADDRPDDTYDREKNACKIWLENAKMMPHIDELQLPGGEQISDAIERILNNKLYLPQNESGTETFIAVYETVLEYFGDSEEADNSIANLTLLDSKTNRSYRNDIFPLKRKTILENCSKDIYIPLCTRNVFLKAYAESTDLLRWTSKDKVAYVKDMKEKISEYLRVEDAQNGN